MTHSSFVGKRTAPSPNRFALSSRYWTKPRSSSSGLGHLCRCVTARDAWPSPRGSGSSAMTSTPCAASERATARPVMWQLKTRARGSGLDAVKGAVDIGEDVRLVLDANGDAQEAIRDPETPPLLRRKPAVRRDRRGARLRGKRGRRPPRGPARARARGEGGGGGCVVGHGGGDS